MKAGAVAVFLVVVHASFVLAQDPPPADNEIQLTLEEAVARALEHDPIVVAARGAVRAAESGERVALGAFLPSLSAVTTTSRTSSERFNPQTGTSVTGSSTSLNAGLSSSLPLAIGGGQVADRRSARATTAAAEATFQERRYDAALAAETAFYEVLRADELIGVAQVRLERASDGREASERRLEAGVATRSDVLRSRLEESDARLQLATARSDRRTAAHALGRLVGEDGPVGAIPPDRAVPRPLAIDRGALVELAATAPSVAAAESRAAAAAAVVSAARSDYLPTLNLSWGTDWFNDRLTFSDARDSWNVRAGLSWPLFNGFRREDVVTRARVEEATARAEAADARRAARAEVERLLAAIDLAEESLALAEESVEVAREDLEVQEERYRVGASTILDRVTSQLALAEAEAAAVEARFDYEVARAELEALVGRSL
ncbi:MAG: TolC family protein [Gemmatimonadota bacterium]